MLQSLETAEVREAEVEVAMEVEAVEEAAADEAVISVVAATGVDGREVTGDVEWLSSLSLVFFFDNLNFGLNTTRCFGTG